MHWRAQSGQFGSSYAGRYRVLADQKSAPLFQQLTLDDPSRGDYVRRYSVAILAPLIALPPAIGFLSAPINRCVAMLGLAVPSGVLFL